ncbi:hypothetical protein CUJ83_12135 [Methanocella sp. CWC-04]|uniref:Uncharacterized protein n=1 Tax=Methanooceanicella nereidis TaxID=2052831 RepID=A0AAP2RED1_9EURY|nr:hypothetical protein [Methanocella sp. CWC-04]MCD1295748.1 hypothetical protein [Methanocella sp. CWC-04]
MFVKKWYVKVAMILAISLLAAVAMPIVYADENIVLNQEYLRKGTNIKVNLIEVDISEKQLGSKTSPYPLEETKWVRLVYTYENLGDKSEKGYLNIKFLDTDNNEYPMGEVEYTGRDVAPHSFSEVRFIEIPVPKDAVIDRFVIIQGFDETTYNIPQTEKPTPTPAITATPGPTQEPPKTCMPFLPFMIAGSVICIGLAINRYGFKR